MRHLIACVVAAFLLCVATTTFAQTFTGAVTGVVKDEQGGILPGVTVTLAGKTGTKTATTDATGTYRFPALDPETYTVTAELSSFRTAKQENVNVTVGSTLNVDFALKLGGLAESVSVVGQTPVVDVKSSATQTGLSQDLLA